MDLTLLLADINSERLVYFRNLVRKLASRKDFTYRLYSVSRTDAWKEIPQSQFPMLSLCLIQLDFHDALSLGRKIYAENPFCRVIYYGNGCRDVTAFLPSRPVRYLDIARGEKEIWTCLAEEYQILLQDNHYFHYADRYQMITCPLSGLLYFYSKDRMVYCQTPSGERGSLRRTLDQIEQMLPPGCYARCHKSFLVRRDLCTGLDKATRELILSEGSRIPVSRAYWKEISGVFDENVVFEDQKFQLNDNPDNA